MKLPVEINVVTEQCKTTIFYNRKFLKKNEFLKKSKQFSPIYLLSGTILRKLILRQNEECIE
ncbi:hypothetical protein GCM10028807_05830 [Spirosoma daeguense]